MIRGSDERVKFSLVESIVFVCRFVVAALSLRGVRGVEDVYW